MECVKAKELEIMKNMRYNLELSYAKIGKIMGCSHEAVRQRLNKDEKQEITNENDTFSKGILNNQRTTPNYYKPFTKVTLVHSPEEDPISIKALQPSQ